MAVPLPVEAQLETTFEFLYVSAASTALPEHYATFPADSAMLFAGIDAWQPAYGGRRQALALTAMMCVCCMRVVCSASASAALVSCGWREACILFSVTPGTEDAGATADGCTCADNGKGCAAGAGAGALADATTHRSGTLAAAAFARCCAALSS